QKFYQINTDACEDCRACVEMTGCPGLSQTFDAYGSKVTIDPQICVSDSYCTKIKVCPSFELVEVANYHPTKYRAQSDNILIDKVLPLPVKVKTLDSIASGSDYRAVVTGVGGSGVTTISRVLAEAAKVMGNRTDIDFKFVDQKGLAQRNGNVTSHLALYKKGKSHAQVTPMGGADVLLSPDLLDGSHHLAFLNAKGMAILDQKFQIPLSLLLDRGFDKNPVNEKVLSLKLKDLLKERIKLLPMKEVSENHLGKSVYASALILGAAFQLGLIPFELKDLEDAFSRTMKKTELENNLKAFTLGRRLALGEDLSIAKKEVSMIELYAQSIKESSVFNGAGLVSTFKEINSELKTIIPETLNVPGEFTARYVHDLLIFDRGANLQSFVNDVKKIVSLYKTEELFKMALRTLAKTYFIKDEVYIAHMMISPMRRLEDENTFKELGSSYKKTFINRPSFDIGDKKVEFDFSPSNWMLKLMRHARFLRRMLPSWHNLEKKISSNIRGKLLSKSMDFKELKALENVKGYRQVRYDMYTTLEGPL
ncbi:MAG: 2-oxoacid:acceptor oxidoreductase family protein, partial [Rhizobacter sp.]|nr:2-oxoacid:acceptor oxidoreductase family protein [Bacteriovorax sp.]